MTDTTVTLSGRQVREILNALDGIGNLVKKVVRKPGNRSEVYAIMSNIAVIQQKLIRMPRVSSN